MRTHRLFIAVLFFAFAAATAAPASAANLPNRSS